jgi:hypothetical protein
MIAEIKNFQPIASAIEIHKSPSWVIDTKI